MGGEPSVIKLVRVLGNVCAVAPDGDIVEIPSVSQRRLLGLLALHTTQRLRTDWLADVLDISPGALQEIRVATACGARPGLPGDSDHGLHPHLSTSTRSSSAIRSQEHLTRPTALRPFSGPSVLWGGAALEEFDGEDWARGEIARLTEIHGAAVDDLADELISAHRPAGCDRSARKPDRPVSLPRPVPGLLIRALALAGRQADALRAFQNYHSVLADELGTEPSPEVVRIERRVATGWDGASSATATDETRGAALFPAPGIALSERSLRGSICRARGAARRAGVGRPRRACAAHSSRVKQAWERRCCSASSRGPPRRWASPSSVAPRTRLGCPSSPSARSSAPASIMPTSTC